MKTNLRQIVSCILILTAYCFSYSQTYDVTLETLLDEMTSYETGALYPDYRCYQQSSYDRRSVTPDNMYWFANDDGGGYYRTETNEGRKEKVLFEHNAPGVITRIWITTFDRTGTLRFYFDGHTSADWTIPAYDFLQFGVPVGLGLCQPHINNVDGGKGGSTFFLPIPYGQSCKVTLEEPYDNFSTPRYYHFNYREYITPKKIETFSQENVDNATQKIATTNDLLLHPVNFTNGNLITKTQTISAGDAIKIDLPAGTNAVKTLQIAVSNYETDDYEQLMRCLVLEADFDNKNTVWVPVSDFSGAGMGAPAVKSWYLSADGKGNIISRWIMPYKDSGEIIIRNYYDKAVTVFLSANVDTYEWKDNSLYFYTSWKQQRNIPVTNLWENCIDWNFASLKGKGVYKGDVLTLYNHTSSWYGEGDEKIYIDDDVFPSHFGTGTEDYYNCSWAPVSPFQTPFGGAPRADYESSTGYNTFFRTRNLDAIPFSSKLKFDIGMLSWTAGTVDYATTVYWYGNEDAIAENTSGVDEATRELLPKPENPFDYTIPNSLEFETLTPSTKMGSISTEVQVMTGFTGFKWSKGKQLLCRNAQVNDYLEYTFDGYADKKCRIQIQGTKAGDFGTLSFSINGNTPVSIDFYNNGVIHTGVISLGEYYPQNGKFTLKITYTGKNPASTGNLFGLDCIQIIESNFKVQNAIEFENYDLSGSYGFTGNFSQEMSYYKNGKWSDKNQKVFVGGTKGAYIDYSFENLDAGEYDVTLYATKGPDFGVLMFDINGDRISSKFDGYHNLVSDSGPIYLGRFNTQNDNSINFKVNVAGTNPFTVEPHYIVGLDCIVLQKTITNNLETTEYKPFYSITNKKLAINDNYKTVGYIRLYNVTGKQVYFANQKKEINLSDFPEGHYIIQLLSDNKMQSNIFYLPK